MCLVVFWVHFFFRVNESSCPDLSSVMLFCSVFFSPKRICLCSRVFFHRKSAGHLLTSNAIWSCAHFRKKTIVFVCLSKLKVNSFHTFNWINHNEMWLPAHHGMNRQIFAFVSNVSSKMLSPHSQHTHLLTHFSNLVVSFSYRLALISPVWILYEHFE